jgi:hypothetical protein
MTGKPTDSAPWEDPCASLRGIIAAAQEPRRFGAAHEMIVPVSLLSAVVAEMIQTRLQRDEARRWVCQIGAKSKEEAETMAIRRGWDCYKETP